MSRTKITRRLLSVLLVLLMVFQTFSFVLAQENTPVQATAANEGNVALGYNFMIIDNFEMTTEVAITIPEEGDGTYAALSIGGIFDLPLLVDGGDAGAEE